VAPQGAGAGHPGSAESNAAAPNPAGSRAQGAEARRGECELSLEASSNLVTAGETVTLSGALTCPNGTSAAGATITVYQREGAGGASTVGELATVSAGEDGSFKLTSPALTSRSIFTVRSPLASHGARAVVRVAPRVTLNGPAASGAQLTTADSRWPRARNRFTFSGTVDPVSAGARVALQLEHAGDAEEWRTVAFGRVGDEGRYSIAHSFMSPGQVSLRVVVRPTDEAPAASEPITYDVAPAQNRWLTILSSADPTVAGRSATITGIAAGEANQEVTLLARTPTSRFTPVARATTNSGGAYVFTVAPTQNTYYRAISHKRASAQLFEGVKYVLATSPPPGAAQAGETVAFTGTLAPAAPGQVVQLERQNPGGIGFHAVAYATVNADGSYSIPYTFSGAGSRIMRIKAPAGAQSEGTASPPFKIAVTP
jgi:hypothetical protein